MADPPAASEASEGGSLARPLVPGCRALVEALDLAVAKPSVEEVVDRVAAVLVAVIEGGALELPPALCRPIPDGYARRLVHRDRERGYTVVAMVWGPGQGTPLHDHAGLWCVETVVSGRIMVSRFELTQQAGRRFHFRPRGRQVAGVGKTGCLIPPFEYHTLANDLPDGDSVTLHVYGGEMDHCHAFRPVGGGWFERERRELSYTP